jgi:hypothetical protein
VGDKQLKDNVKSLLKSNLWEMKVLKSSVMPPVPIYPTGFVSQETLSLTFEQLKELFCLCMQLEMEMEVTLEKLRQRTELAKLGVETERLKLIKEGILGDKSRTRGGKNNRFFDASRFSLERFFLEADKLIIRINKKNIILFFIYGCCNILFAREG